MMPRDQELVCNLPVLNLALKARKMGEIMLRFEGKGHTEVFCGFFFDESRHYGNPEFFSFVIFFSFFFG